MIEELTFQLNEIAQPDSLRIANATAALKIRFYQDPASLKCLIEIMQGNPVIQIRQLAAVEARKVVAIHWPSLNHQDCSAIRGSILQSTLSEENKAVRQASARVIAAIAKIDMPEGAWQDLPNFLVSASTSGSSSDRLVGVFILSTLFEVLEDFFADKILDLFRLFSGTIQDSESAEVRLTTLLAVGNLSELIDGEDKQSVKAFREILPLMVRVLRETIESDDSQHAKQAFEIFQTLLILEPSLIAKHVADLLQFMVELSTSQAINEDYRCMAISWITNCTRYRRNKIKALKVGRTLAMAMLKIATEEDSEDQEEDCPSRLAYRCIDTLSTSLPPSHVYEVLVSSSEQMLQSTDAGDRKAALICLGVGIEGAVEYASDHIEFILSAINKGLADTEPIVQRAALLTLGQLADELPSEVSSEHETLLPLVFNLVHSNGDKVGRSAMSALEVLLESLEKQDILRYLPRLMSAFYALLTGSETDASVRSTVIAAIGSAAHSAEESFVPYLDTTMTQLLPYLAQTGTNEDLDTRGVVTDTCGAIAGAVGKQHFSPYTATVVQAAYDGLQLNHPRLKECAYVFFAILARVLEQEFGSYIDLVVPALLHTLQQDETGAMLDGNPDKVSESVEDIDLSGQTDSLDGDDEEALMNSLGFNSAIAMEKEIAADALGEIFAHAKHSFAKYIDDACSQLIKCLDHFYEGVRKAAIGSLFRFIATMYTISEPPQWIPGIPLQFPLHADLNKYFELIRGSVLETLGVEDEKLVAIEICRNLAETTKVCGPSVLGTEKDLEFICDQLLSILQKKHPAQTSEYDMEEPLDPTEDSLERDETDSAEYDAILIDAAADTLIALSRALGEQFEQPFGLFLPCVVKFSSSKSASERATAVACLGEVATGLKGAITVYTETIYPVLLDGLQNSDKEVRSNSAYAMGLLCEYSRADLGSQYMTILSKLQPLFEGSNHRLAKDNAIGCTARMILSRKDAIPLSKVLPVLVSQLPLKDDYSENQPVYKMVCYLYSLHDPTVMLVTPQLMPILESVLNGDPNQLEEPLRANLLELYSALHQSSA